MSEHSVLSVRNHSDSQKFKRLYTTVGHLWCMQERRKAFRKPGTSYLPPKQKDIRFLLLSLALALLFCGVFAFALFFLNKQGRI